MITSSSWRFKTRWPTVPSKDKAPEVTKKAQNAPRHPNKAGKCSEERQRKETRQPLQKRSGKTG